MLDGKILAAVLATLTAIAVTTGQGASTQNMDLQAPEVDEFSVQDVRNNPLDKIRDIFTTTPEPENKVEATLKVNDLSNEIIELKSAEITSNSTKQVQLGDKSIYSDSQITFYGFKGTLTPVNDTMITGTVEGALTSGVNISGTSPVSQKLNTSRLEVNKVKESKINLGKVTGSINSNSASTSFNSPRPLDINSFSGNIVIYPGNSTVMLDGKVARLEAGSFTFGG
jgi:hypothetical protein